MIVTIDINDNVADKILYFLDQFKNDVKILKREPENSKILEIEEIKEDDEDYKYILEARKARKKGEKTYDLDDVIKEFE